MNEALKDPEELEFKNTKYPHLKLATGGGNPVDPNDTVWLKRYDVGTVFRAKKKGDFVVYLFVVDNRTDKTYSLVGKGMGELDVDPFGFCQVFSFHELVRSSEETLDIVNKRLEEQKEKEQDDGTGNGAV
jgi:hypothetical protein